MEERTELISRQVAIETVCYNCTEKGICNGVCDDTDRLRDLPTIKPKRGKWIKIEDAEGDINSVQCSECLDDFDYIDGLCYLCHGQELPNYCPNCGARMDGE